MKRTTAAVPATRGGLTLRHAAVASGPAASFEVAGDTGLTVPAPLATAQRSRFPAALATPLAARVTLEALVAAGVSAIHARAERSGVGAGVGVGVGGPREAVDQGAAARGRHQEPDERHAPNHSTPSAATAAPIT
jgi:hypothetical protein